ncbi:hypothetical protein KDL29_09370 [bacterium]|nr:hypothetical protein [bacterium]MCB1220757.1 hypothetical protein [bacterium]UNM09406.1 MAG: hypothetical protein H7A35_04955 [Planctomycetales bacterium]
MTLDLSKEKWFVDFCEPIVHALYARDTKLQEQRMQEAWKAHEAVMFPEEENSRFFYQLTYLEYQVRLVQREEGWAMKYLPGILNRLEQESSFESAEMLRRRLYLQLRITMDRLEFLPLDQTTMDRLLSVIPLDMQTSELWNKITSWAYKLGNEQYLIKSYDFAINNARGLHANWNWVRAYALMRIVQRLFNKEDLLWVMDNAEFAEHIKYIQKDIWQPSLQLGIVDEDVEQSFEQRIKQITDDNGESLMDVLKRHFRNPEFGGGNSVNTLTA